MSWLSRLKNVFRPDALVQEITDEMKDHIDRRAAALHERGLSEDEAARQAILRFGNVMLRREESRDIRSWAALDSVAQDVRYGWRMMVKNWGYAATAIFSLGLAIGANTAIFSIVDAAMLRPLPVAHPEQLIDVTFPKITDPGEEALGENDSFSYPLYLALRTAARNAAHFGLFSYPSRREARIPGAASPLEHVMMQHVSGDAFEILGVRPTLGRLFSTDDDRTPGAHPFAVLSYEYWRSRFGADPAVLKSSIQIGDKTYFIIGVAQKGFFGVEPGAFIDVWLPAMMYPQKEAFTHPGWHWFRIMGRLKPGASSNELRARLQAPFHDHEQEMLKRFPTIPPAIRKQMLELPIHVVSASSGRSGFRQTFARPLWIIFGVAGIILLIACANLAGLLLARSMARAAEMSMRISLGASRTRLMRQLVTESLLLSALAGGFGWLAARFIAPLLVQFLSRENEPVRFALAMNTRMLLFCIAVSAMATIFFGLLPAWQASGVQPMLAARFLNRGNSKLRTGSVFVAVQVAFTFCLVLMASAFLLSLHRLVSVDTGFDRRNVSVLSIAAQWKHEPQNVQRSLIDQLQRRIAALPGVGSRSLTVFDFFGSHME